MAFRTQVPGRRSVTPRYVHDRTITNLSPTDRAPPQRIEVSWCIQSGHGTRVIPSGAITGAHFVQTPDFVQVTGKTSPSSSMPLDLSMYIYYRAGRSHKVEHTCR